MPVSVIGSWVALVLSCAAFFGSAERAAAETVALIGTGNVGAALGRRFAEHGHSVVYGSRNPAAADVVELVRETGHGATALPPREAAARSRVVVLAVHGRRPRTSFGALKPSSDRLPKNSTPGRTRCCSMLSTPGG